MQDPDYITPKEACAVIGGTKAISLPTFYRDPELRALIEHPSRGISESQPAPPDCFPQGAGCELELVNHASHKCCEARLSGS